MATRALNSWPDAAMSTALSVEELERFVRERPAEVDAALQQVSPVIPALGLVEMAALFGVRAGDDPALFAARTMAWLTAYKLIDEFAAVLLGERTAEALANELRNMEIDPVQAAKLFSVTHRARCAVYVAGAFSGSGFLVGPSLVLTCAHVIEGAGTDGSFPGVEVVLDGEVRVGVEAEPVLYSPLAGVDRDDPLPFDDLMFEDCHDFALLRLRMPRGANTPLIDCPVEEWSPSRRAQLFLLHYPRGEDRGVGAGQLASFRRPSRRWGYATPAADGSSGGAVLNAKGQLIGIHQGKISGGKRLIPLNLFRTGLAEKVANDLMPDYVWLPEGNLAGSLAIGRGELFRAFAKLADPRSPHRLLRIRRPDPGGSVGGLGFSAKLVRQLVARLSSRHREITLSWPQVLFSDFDILASLAAQAAAASLLDSPHAPDGQAQPLPRSPPPSVPHNQAAVRATERQVQDLLHNLDEAARDKLLTLWIVIEHSTLSVAHQIVALELLASHAARFPSLRLVLIGHETVTLAQDEFRVTDVEQNNLPGVALVEYLRPITRSDVADFISGLYASTHTSALPDDLLKNYTDEALSEATPTLNAYEGAEVSNITRKLRELLRTMLPAELRGPGG